MAGKKTRKNAPKSAKAKAATQASLSSLKAISDKQTKGQILTSLAEETGLAKKEINAVFEVLGKQIVRHMKKRGSGEFTIPHTGIRVIRRTRPATKKRMGRNPATGETIVIAAKPARTIVRIRALKALKESVNL